MKIHFLVINEETEEIKKFISIETATKEATRMAEEDDAAIYIYSLQGCMKPAKPPIVWEGSEY